MKLNLGCGRDYRAGWENWDISRLVKADRYIDIRKELFGSKEKFDEIYCSGVLEQILANEDLVHVLNECWHSLKPTGVMTVVVPNAKFSNAFKDPMDVRQFTEETFVYLCAGFDEYKLYGSVYGFKPWSIQSIFTNQNGIISAMMQKA